MRVERQGEAEIGVERALVELVEQHGGDAVEGGIVEDHADEHALGHDLYPRVRRDEALQADAQADGLAHLLAERRGHAGCGGAGRQAPGLEHDQTPALDPGVIEEGERDAGRLAGAGRGDQHRARMRRERRLQVGQDLVDRKWEARIESHKSDRGPWNNTKAAAPPVGEGAPRVKSASNGSHVEWTSN